MKKLPIYLLSLATLAAPLSWAGQYRTVDYAQVTSATPVFRVVETQRPIENCWNERVREERPVNRRHQATTEERAAGALVGSIVGGTIGHAVGRGDDNKRIGTVVGAVLGASIGNELSRTARYTEVSYRNVERCEVRYQASKERVIDGYDVTYRYRGHDYHTHTRKHPGQRIKVELTVRPIER